MEDTPVKVEAKMPITVTKGTKIKTLPVPSNNTSIKDFFEVIHHLPKIESNLKHEIVEILEPSIDQKQEILTENKKETVDVFMLNVKKRLSFFEAPTKAKLHKTTEITSEIEDVVEKIEIPETQLNTSVNSIVLIEESPLQLNSTPEIHQITDFKDQVIHSQLKQELIVNEDFRDLDTDQQLEVWNYLKPSFVKKQNNRTMMDSTLFKMKFNRITNVLQLYQKKKPLTDKNIVAKVSLGTKVKGIPKPLIPMTPLNNSTMCDDPKTPDKQSVIVNESFETPMTTANDVLIEMLPKPVIRENIILNDIFDSYVKEDSIIDLESLVENVFDSKDFVKQQLKTDNSQLVVKYIINVSSQDTKATSEKMKLVDDNFAKDFLASMDDDDKIIKSSTQLNGIFTNTPSLSESARKIKKSQLMSTGLKVCENIVMKILDQNNEVTKETNGHLDFLFEQSLKPSEENNIYKDQERPINRRINFKDEIKESSVTGIDLNVPKPKAKVSSTSRAIGELQLLHEKFRMNRNTQLSNSHDISDILFNSSGSGQKKLQLHQKNNDDRQAKLNICKQKLDTHNGVDSYLNDFIRVKFSDGL